MTTGFRLEALAALWRWFIQALQELAERWAIARRVAWLTRNQTQSATPNRKDRSYA